jgi:NAD-dependent SIR2 family protein deacetylase
VIADLCRIVEGGGVVVLTGAGMSTDSGIPDYRGTTGARRRGSPMTFRQFVDDPIGRRRYWARSHVGWRHIAGAHPNVAHVAVARLEADGRVTGVITQNVDGLHQAAGSRRVVELHGALSRTVCLGCGDRRSRLELHHRLEAANPRFGRSVATIAPDGDADLPELLVDGFTVVGCLGCGGDLKPDVVFFGESVPRERVARCMRMVERASLLLVLGSSLTVMSGYRFVLQAARLGIPVAIVNRGATRGDDVAAVRIDGGLAEVLPALTSPVPSPVAS